MESGIPASEHQQDTDKIKGLGRQLSTDDRYEILEELGQGGAGVVYKAYDRSLGRTVAIKLLKKSQMSNEKAMLRFRQEARILSTLKQPNIVNVFTFGTTPDKRPYLVTEFLEGFSLRQLLEKQRTIPESIALKLFGQICQGLSYAHSLGVRHRDLKPENLMLSPDEEGVKIIDFGLGGLTPREDLLKLTQSHQQIGTPDYMSPEQALGEEVDEKSDIYSLACVLYEVLAGENPFIGNNALDTLNNHRHLVPEPIAGVSPRTNHVLAIALSKKREDRFASVDELTKALETGESPMLEKAKPHSRRSGSWYRVLASNLALLVLICGLLVVGIVWTDPLGLADPLTAAVLKNVPLEPGYKNITIVQKILSTRHMTRATMVLYQKYGRNSSFTTGQRIQLLSDLYNVYDVEQVDAHTEDQFLTFIHDEILKDRDSATDAEKNALANILTDLENKYPRWSSEFLVTVRQLAPNQDLLNPTSALSVTLRKCYNKVLEQTLSPETIHRGKELHDQADEARKNHKMDAALGLDNLHLDHDEHSNSVVDPVEIGMDMHAIALDCYQMGKQVESYHFLKLAGNEFRQAGCRGRLADVLSIQAQILLNKKDYDSAVLKAQDALKEIKPGSEPTVELEMQIYLSLGQGYRATKNDHKARDYLHRAISCGQQEQKRLTREPTAPQSAATKGKRDAIAILMAKTEEALRALDHSESQAATDHKIR